MSLEAPVPRDAVLPSGTVAFFFSDIEGSTTRWEQHRDAMVGAVKRHDELVREAIASHGGVVFKTVGDAFCAAFTRVPPAIAAAVAAQRAMQAEDWGEVDGLQVRMGVHAGAADERDGDYFGPVVNRVARLLSVGHGGQILVSGVAADLAQGELEAQIALRDLGSHRLKDLAYPEQVYQVVTPGLPEHFPPLRTLDVLPNNLPEQLTSFLGRAEEVAAIRALLERSRLVTLVGTGGVGKTRTALQVAAEVMDRFAHGAWFIDLAPIREPSVIESVIASAIGIRTASVEAKPNDILDALRAKSTFLVFDNCEHLVRDAAIVIDRILRHCPKITILATSREGLNIAGETVYRMPSLLVPPRGRRLRAHEARAYGAVALFDERAQAAEPSFALTDDNADDVAEICRQLDGIALAIELAAPRLKVLSPSALLARLTERLRLLTGGNRAARPRQQTMRALIDWSYDLLDEKERSIFRRLSVFAGGCTLELATSICTDDEVEEWDVLDILTALVDKSLIATELGCGGQRYRMLESTRQYARERLAQSGEQQRFLRRHAEAVAALVGSIVENYWRQPLLRSRDRAADELDNIRAALTWLLVEGADTRLGVRIVGDAGVAFYVTGSVVEWIQWLRLARGHVDASTPPADVARLDLASFSIVDFADAEFVADASARAVKAYAALGRPLEHLVATIELAKLCGRLGRSDDAIAASDASFAMLATMQEPILYAEALRARSMALPRTLEYSDERIASVREAAAILRVRGDEMRLALALIWLSEESSMQGLIADAIAHTKETVRIYRDCGIRGSLTATATVNLAAYELRQNRFDEAYGYGIEGLALARDLGAAPVTAGAFQHLAAVAAADERFSAAAHLLGYSAARTRESRRPRDPQDDELFQRTVQAVKEALGAEAFQQEFAAGMTLVEDVAAAEALRPPCVRGGGMVK